MLRSWCSCGVAMMGRRPARSGASPISARGHSTCTSGIDAPTSTAGQRMRAARPVMGQWTDGLIPGMRIARGVTLALEVAGSYWRGQRPLARLILEGGPSFGTAAHLRLVGEFAAVLQSRFRRPNGSRLPAQD